MWNDGYVMGIDYINAYFYGLNPLNIDFNLTLAGVKNTKDSSISYLELGFGKGYSLALHSVCNKGEFIGVDFNPSFAFNTKELSPNSKIYNESFKDFYKRAISEKMSFDYIVLHGVWSWINSKNKKYIQKIIDKCLNIGGIVYISYNSFPGWEGGYSLQKILKAFEERQNETPTTKIKNSLEILEQFSKIPMSFLQQNPKAKEEILYILNQDISVLAHEFFNKHWSCHHFLDIAEMMQECKCEFASSANVLWHFDDLTLSQEELNFLNTLQCPLLQEQIKDFFVNRKFRADLFIKGKCMLSTQEREQKLLKTAFVLLREDAKIQGLENIAEVQKIYSKILNFLTLDNFAPKTIEQIIQACDITLLQVLQILCVMMTYQITAPTQNISQTQIQNAKAFNHKALQQNHDKIYLASPLIGGGFSITQQEATKIRDYLNNKNLPTNLNLGFYQQLSIL